MGPTRQEHLPQIHTLVDSIWSPETRTVAESVDLESGDEDGGGGRRRGPVGDGVGGGGARGQGAAADGDEGRRRRRRRGARRAAGGGAEEHGRRRGEEHGAEERSTGRRLGLGEEHGVGKVRNEWSTAGSGVRLVCRTDHFRLGGGILP